ncbi:MAG: hypothetical protein EZS28_029904 [Streblomastix strix]|uniref:C2 domain-containing protein n=1 Tax=Streblomastix strix TaxID=222440 RepID=A0A5J4UWN3_9EUKA|nr:MAG: hypothetical protein EZS28_029904 [Streblomastix strix]
MKDEFNKEVPAGKVTVTVISVANVTPVDLNGKADPYIKCIIGKDEKRTKKKADILEAEERDIKYELWDHDTIGHNDKIGEVKLLLREFLINREKKTITFKGTDKQQDKDEVGQGLVEVFLEPIGDGEFAELKPPEDDGIEINEELPGDEDAKTAKVTLLVAEQKE